jgi:hypothetical protein
MKITALNAVCIFASIIIFAETSNAALIQGDDSGMGAGNDGFNLTKDTDTGNPGNSFGRPDRVPPVNPPIDTPAFYNGLANTPAMMPASVPSHTLPGSGFGQTVVPVPAAVWLFGSGLLGLIGVAKRKRG